MMTPRDPSSFDVEHFAGRINPELWGTPAADDQAERLYLRSTGLAPRGGIAYVGAYQDGTTVRIPDSAYYTVRWSGKFKGEICSLVTIPNCRFHKRHNLNCDECGGWLTVAGNEPLERERQVSNDD